MDLVARAWCRGSASDSGDANPATHRTMKGVRRRWLVDGDTVHYLWSLPEPLTQDTRRHLEKLCHLARSVVALGWGIDMVVGHGAVLSDHESKALRGERWLPGLDPQGNGLRVPVRGSLEALLDRHARFLARIGADGFTAPPPLTVYSVVAYRAATEAPSRPVAAFSLLKPDFSGFRPFDTARRALTVAGMTRHAVKIAAEHAGWPQSRINAFVLGHAETSHSTGHTPVGARRFAYLPLPSIEGRGDGKGAVVGSVRRVLVSSFAENCDGEIAWAQRMLSGADLVEHSAAETIAVLSALPRNEAMVRRYTGAASSWATVTPVVLPGYDDPAHYRRRLKSGTSADQQRELLGRLSARTEMLLRKAIGQAGFSDELAEHAELEWGKVGFLAGVEPAERYGVPEHLRRLPRLHVALRWRDGTGRPVEVRGPVCIGGGRFYGVGLFASL
jgi:CRISPR-associated protein Csb2